MSETTPTVEWTGASGKAYKYWVFAMPFSFTAGQAGNYIFAKQVNGVWNAVYIGQTGDLGERFDDHHQKDCILRNGATHVHAHTAGGEKVRLDEEADLLRRGTTSCNG